MPDVHAGLRSPEATQQLRETEFYTSHEALLLDEEPLTRQSTITADKGWYSTSGI